MNILYWTDGFWPRVGGIETQALQFIDSMKARGHQFSVIAHQEHPNRKTDEIFNGIPIKRFPYDTILAKSQLQQIRMISDYLLQIRKEFKPDLLHLNVCLGWGALLFLLIKSEIRIPTVLTVHAPFIFRDKISQFFSAVTESVDQICCVSNWLMEEMRHHIPSSINKLKLIYNGLTIPEIKPSPINMTPPKLLLLGRLAPEKGFEVAIEAFTLLKNGGSNAELIIAGDGPELKNLERKTKALEVNHSVKFMGECTRQQVPLMINEAAMVILPSKFEAFGLVAVEAMQMQRPVIASAVGGLQEIIIDQETGLLIPPNNPALLCAAIEGLFADPERIIKMGIAGRKIVEEKFTLSQHVLQYERMYQQLIGKSR